MTNTSPSARTRSSYQQTRKIGISVNAVVNSETIAELQAEYLPTRDLERVIKRRKQLAVQRHLRIAEQYIANVALEEFPKRKAR